MDRNSARLLCVIAMVFTGFAFAILGIVALFLILVTLPLLLVGKTGFYIFYMIAMVLILPVFIPMAFMLLTLLIGYNYVYRPMKRNNFRESTKTFVWIAMILSFLGGGGPIPFLMYLIILVSWRTINKKRKQRKIIYKAVKRKKLLPKA